MWGWLGYSICLASDHQGCHMPELGPSSLSAPWSHASCPAVAEASFPERQTWSHLSLGANRLALEEQLLKFPNASFITKWRNAAKCPKVITFGLVPPSLFQSPCADRAPPSWVADHTSSGEKNSPKYQRQNSPFKQTLRWSLGPR